MKWIIFIVLIVLVSGLVIADTEPTRPVRKPYMPPAANVKPNITEPIIVNTVVVPPKVNITPVQGGEVIDLSTPNTAPINNKSREELIAELLAHPPNGTIGPRVEYVENNSTTESSPKLVEQNISVKENHTNIITHSFWYWLWPPHWFTK